MKLWVAKKETVEDEEGVQYLIHAYVTTERPTDNRLIKSGPYPFFLSLEQYNHVERGKVYHLDIGEEVREEFEGTVVEAKPPEGESESDG